MSCPNKWRSFEPFMYLEMKKKKEQCKLNPHPPTPTPHTRSVRLFLTRAETTAIQHTCTHWNGVLDWLNRSAKKIKKKSALSTSVDRHSSEIAWVSSETATPQKSRALYKKERRRRKKCSKNCMPKLEFVKIRGPAFACYVSVLNAALTAHIIDGIRPITVVPRRLFS